MSRVLYDLHLIIIDLDTLNIVLKFFSLFRRIPIWVNSGQWMLLLAITADCFELLICRNWGSLQDCVWLVIWVVHLAWTHTRELGVVLLGVVLRVEVRLYLTLWKHAWALQFALSEVFRALMQVTIDVGKSLLVKPSDVLSSRLVTGVLWLLLDHLLRLTIFVQNEILHPGMFVLATFFAIVVWLRLVGGLGVVKTVVRHCFRHVFHCLIWRKFWAVVVLECHSWVFEEIIFWLAIRTFNKV